MPKRTIDNEHKKVTKIYAVIRLAVKFIRHK